MDTAELAHLREQLLERKDFLEFDHNARLLEVRRSGDHVTADEVDLAAESTEFDITVHAAFRDGQELDAVIEALRKLEEGSYGKCEECRKAINPKRLQALPYATLCIDCQRLAEKHGAFSRSAFKDSSFAFDEDGE